jgi:hypothetical protein
MAHRRNSCVVQMHRAKNFQQFAVISEPGMSAAGLGRLLHSLSCFLAFNVQVGHITERHPLSCPAAPQSVVSPQKVPSIEEYIAANGEAVPAAKWHPEYEPESILPPHETACHLERYTHVQRHHRKRARHAPSKIVCTLGPCLQHGGAAGQSVGWRAQHFQVHFSHGSHDVNAACLERFVQVRSGSLSVKGFAYAERCPRERSILRHAPGT